MAHVSKYTASAVGHLFNHYGRAEIDQKVHRSNEKIDDSLTKNNYNVAAKDQPKNPIDFLHDRLSEIRVHKRADVNVMADWVVTLPKDIKPGGKDERLFFDTAYFFLKRRYGAENVISAWVHTDETTPHMHYSFVPAVEDKKRGGFKLSAKEALNREDLRSFHKDFDEFTREIYGRSVGVLNDATRDGNVAIADLKRKTAIEERDSLAREVAELQKRKKGLQGKIKRLADGIDKAVLTKKQIKAINARKGVLGGVTGVTVEDIEKVKNTAMVGSLAVIENQELRRENKELRDEKAQMANQLQAYRKKESGIKGDLERRKRQAEIEKKAAAFDRLPDEQKKRLLAQDLGKKRDFEEIR